jgi:hypothetical protein
VEARIAEKRRMGGKRVPYPDREQIRHDPALDGLLRLGVYSFQPHCSRMRGRIRSGEVRRSS